jgi:parvulin-like peptidyl-prolyl isomerase
MAKEQKSKVLSKKHLARIEREQMQTRWILIASGLVLLIVIGLVAYGILEQSFFRPRQAVAIVNGDKISTMDFQARVRYTRQGIVSRYNQYVQFAQAFGNDQSTQQMFSDQLQQIASQLDPIPLGQQVLDEMIGDKLVAQEATKRGITVSDVEIDKLLQDSFGYFPNGTSTPKPELPTNVPETLSPTQLALVTATPTVTPTLTATATPVLTTTPSATATPTLVPSATSIPSATPVPTQYTESMYQNNLKTEVAAFKTNINLSESQFREIVRVYILRQNLMEAITADLPTQQDQAWLKDLVVADEETAKTAKQRLNNGEDFAKLVTELSIDTNSKSNGGDAGWLTRDKMEAGYAEMAFNLSIGQISDPVQDSRGWHILQLVDHRTYQLSTTEYDQLRQDKFQQWLTTQREASTVKIFDYWMNRVPSDPALPTTTTGQ